ncbi:hypothetical protein CTA1_11467 [Colletotrichum tanaceti]|uniref:Uncharacterized protein n=1 Tax=Colletotrichum tanaceti TaxID=1306861 RepID=A0A4U6XRT9_9PEZI|nr:hypothetical protein CTA1_11467 [Colletotrichum tanaceti]
MKTLSDDELRGLAGQYFVPKGLYQYTKSLPFLGDLKCDTSTLVAGQWTEISTDCTIGASGHADGAWIKGTFKFYSDWALFQTSDPRQDNYVSAEYMPGPLHDGQTPATVQSLAVRFDQKGTERPFQKAIIIIDIVIFDTRTSGDFDGVDTFLAENSGVPPTIRVSGHLGGYVKVGDVIKGSPHKPHPQFDLVVSKEEAVRPGGRKEDIRGGAELFVSVESLLDVPLPRRVEGSFPATGGSLTTGPSRAVYFVRREHSGGKVIASPVFIKNKAKCFPRNSESGCLPGYESKLS